MLCTNRIFRSMDQYLGPGSTMVDTVIDGEDLDQAADALLAEAGRHPGPVGIVGLSLGAIVAMAACAKVPTAFSAAILISTNPRGPRREQLRAWNELATRNAQGGLAGIAKESAPALFAKGGYNHGLVPVAEEMALAVGPRQFERQLAIQASRTDLRPSLASIEAPTLVLAGAEDQLCGRDMHMEIATHMQDAELHLFPRLGHLLTLEDPALAATRINTWIQRRSL